LFSVRGVRISSFAGIYAHAWVQNPIIHPSHREVLFAYGVNAAFTIRTHYELLCNSYNLRVAGMKKFVQIIRANVGSESHHSPFASRSAVSLWGERCVHDSDPLRVAPQLVQRARSTHIKFRRRLRARMGSESHHSPFARRSAFCLWGERCAYDSNPL